LAKINVDEDETTPEKYGVSGIPHVVLIKNG
jgi:thioredoxin-like negative regulator of GroEL